MAIIIDPDFLDREQVIYASRSAAQNISLYPVGTFRAGSGHGNGNTVSGTRTFTALSGTPFANAVTGDILVVKSAEDAGHYTIANVNSSTVVTTAAGDAAFTTNNNGVFFAVHANSGGTITDGVTEQCVYSYSKEEWRTDSTFKSTTGNTATGNATVSNIAVGTAELFVGQGVSGTGIQANSWITSVSGGNSVVLNNQATANGTAVSITFAIDNDDLIRHPFPFEPITAEQFEIGGGAAHENWDWFNSYTVKKVRTGGWAAKNTGGTTLTEYTGIVTLGSLDADTQVYFLQGNAGVGGYFSAPTDFTFLGPVNEPIFVWDSTDNRRGFLKLFARKKARSYAQSEIADIGVTTIQTIVNRFPLAHALDAAIIATDGEILGTTPWRTPRTFITNTNGSKTISQNTFTSAGQTFLGNVAIGDTLRITSGTEQGYYTIGNVDSDTQVTISSDAEFSTWASSESSLSFDITTTYYFIGAANARVLTDATLTNIDGNTGNITSATANFVTANVQPGDIVLITESGSAVAGQYEVITRDSATVLTVDTTDQIFAGQTNIDYSVVKPGMYFQFKNTPLTLGGTGNLQFFDTNPDIINRESGSWSGDGVTTGDIVTISGTTNNDGSYTVATVTAANLTLVATDTLVAEGPLAATATVAIPFKRTINNVVYGFNWKVVAQAATASNVYQFAQHQLRQTSDIDWGNGLSRGDITDSLMSYASPTGTTQNLIIDDIDNDDLNNVTYIDATDASRVYPFSSSITLNFNNNLQNDAAAKYWVFFTNDDAGDNTGRDYGTKDAILVQNSAGNDVTGTVSGQPSVQFTYDYDGNVQRGGASAGVNAPVTVVAIGLNTAQFVITTGTITRSKGISISLVSALERNYSNPV